MVDTYLLTMRCPVYRQRESHAGFRMELENLVGDGNGEGTSGETVRPTVRMRQPGTDYSVVAMRQGNSCGAKGGGSPTTGLVGQPETGGTDGPDGRRQSPLGGTSRMNREVHVRNL